MTEHRGWRVVARHQLGSVFTTAVDFGVMIAVVHLGLTPVAGTAIGASCANQPPPTLVATPGPADTADCAHLVAVAFIPPRRITAQREFDE